jgi:hypothetical protein
MPKHHEITVKLEKGDDPEHSGPNAVPNVPGDMAVGDTVHYSSNDGVVTIEFFVNGSPFQNADGSEMQVISSNDPPLVLMKASNPSFTCRCFITQPGKTERIG